jgi:ADP-heptose:LPS heptosyltransferase
MRRWVLDQGYRGGLILAVHTGAGHPIRRWRQPCFDNVLDGLRVTPGFVIFIQDRGAEAPAFSGALAHTQWNGTLVELKALLSICDVFLGTDSGVMHMAAAAGCLVVTVLGPGEPTWFRPTGDRHLTVLEPNMDCRPCLDACIFDRPVCLDAVSDHELSRAVDEQLKRAVLQGDAPCFWRPKSVEP